MEITFKYNGKIISTPNLEKKLKRMKISINDIEILEKIEDVKKEPTITEEPPMRQIIVRSTEDEIRRVCYIPKDLGFPPISKLFKNHMWNPETKTGIKELTKEFLMTMYYEKGVI